MARSGLRAANEQAQRTLAQGSTKRSSTGGGPKSTNAGGGWASLAPDSRGQQQMTEIKAVQAPMALTRTRTRTVTQPEP